jgi:hypothetical protein
MGKFAIHTPVEGLMVATLVIYITGVGAVDFLLLRRLAQYIQARHPAAWKALSIKSPYSLRFRSYVRGKEYLQLNDSRLNEMFQFKSRFDTYTGIVFIGSLGLLILLAKQGY